MTKQELINSIEEEIGKLNSKFVKEVSLGNESNAEYYRGKKQAYDEFMVLISSLSEESLINPYIQVKTLRYDTLSLGCEEYTKTFKGLIDFTLWLRYVQFKMPDLILSEVSYINKKER